MKKKIGFVSLGCAKNLTDTETMLALLKNENYIITPDADQADIIVVNTCAFIDSAKEESINAILEMAEKGAGQGMIGIFRLAEGEKDEVRVYPRGVDPSKTYAVTLDNFGSEAVFTGTELIQNGLRVRLGGALTSELILYRAQ